MNACFDQAREYVLDQVLGATTLVEIAAAKQALRDWLQVHPEEVGMREGFEQLYLLEEIVLEQQAEKRAHEAKVQREQSVSDDTNVIEHALSHGQPKQQCVSSEQFKKPLYVEKTLK